MPTPTTDPAAFAMSGFAGDAFQVRFRVFDDKRVHERQTNIAGAIPRGRLELRAGKCTHAALSAGANFCCHEEHNLHPQ